MRKLSRLEQAAILSLLVIAVVHGSTKPSQPSFRANSPVRTGSESVSETSLSPEQLSAGFVLTEIKTNETHDFAAPPDAVIHERWLKRGAAEDVFSLAPANWSFPFGTNVFQKLFVASTGGIYFNHSPMFSNGSSLAPFCTSLGIVPEANWEKIHSETPLMSRFWHRLTPSNSLLLTWQNALLARDTNIPVSIQAELFPNGDFSFRYDLHAISNVTEIPVFSIGAWNDGFGESFTNLARLVPTGTLVWKHLPPNATATSDDDDDGLSTADELFLYRTDPECVDTDCDGVPDGTEVATRLDPLSRDTDGDGLVDGSDPAPAAATPLDDLDGLRESLVRQYECHRLGIVIRHRRFQHRLFSRSRNHPDQCSRFRVSLHKSRRGLEADRRILRSRRRIDLGNRHLRTHLPHRPQWRLGTILPLLETRLRRSMATGGRCVRMGRFRRRIG